MAAFTSFEKRMQGDVRDLHDHLWHPGWKGDPEALFASLRTDAAKLDAFLRVGGRLKRTASALARRKEGHTALFELLHHSYHLTAAAERIRQGRSRQAGGHIARAIESMSIGLCAAAGCFPIVQEWEAGKMDFGTYVGMLADALEAKGVADPGQYKRMLVAVRTFAKGPGGRTRVQRDLAARTAMRGALWCASETVSLAGAVGAPPRFRQSDYAAVLAAIGTRV